MSLEFDHMFICVSEGGQEEASRLALFGLTEGPPNSHAGQGTACRRFFFANGYLELLWVSSAAEAQSATTNPTHLWERWQHRAGSACPFGLGFRPATQHNVSVPFRTWEYRPSYLPAPLTIHVAANAHVLTEPMLFYLSFGQRPDIHPTGRRPPLHHPAGVREVTRIELASPHADRLTPEMAAMTADGVVRSRAGPEYLVELAFDAELREQQMDFRPLLPLLFRW